MIVVAIIQKIADPNGKPWNRKRIERLSRCLRLSQRIRIHIEIAGRGAANPKLRVDSLYDLNGDLVQLEILLLRSAAKKRFVQVRLVPHLKVPLADLSDSIAIDAVLDKCMDQVRPLVVIRWRAAIGVPPESRALHRGSRG